MTIKTVDFSRPVHNLAQQDPDFIAIMVEAGFDKKRTGSNTRVSSSIRIIENNISIHTPARGVTMM